MPTGPQIAIQLSPQAYSYLTSQQEAYGYNGRGLAIRGGLHHYLLSLIHENPTTSYSLLTQHYGDNRPPSVRERDIYLLRQRRFPLWTLSSFNYDETKPFETRRPRSFNKQAFHTLLPDLLRISAHFMISGNGSRQEHLHVRAAAVIEAIGLQYLTLLNPPLHNPLPIDPERRRQYLTHRRRSSTELVFRTPRRERRHPVQRY